MLQLKYLFKYMHKWEWAPHYASDASGLKGLVRYMTSVRNHCPVVSSQGAVIKSTCWQTSFLSYLERFLSFRNTKFSNLTFYSLVPWSLPWFLNLLYQIFLESIFFSQKPSCQPPSMKPSYASCGCSKHLMVYGNHSSMKRKWERIIISPKIIYI